MNDTVSGVAFAVFPLIGVVIGAVLTGGVQWFFARRSERRATRTASKLVNSELAEYADLENLWLTIKIFRVDWWKPPSVWPVQRTELAANLPDPLWGLVDEAYRAINATGDDCRDIERESAVNPETARLRCLITAEAEVHRRKRLNAIEAARKALLEFLGGKSAQSQEPPTGGLPNG